MKNVKLLFVFLVFTGLVSCNNDDDGIELSDGDRIVGVWNIQSIILDGEEWELSDCELQSRMSFTANGNITVTSRYDDVDTEECVSEVNTLNWEYRGNNVYRITDEDGSEDITFLFSNNDNTFTITEEDEDGYSETLIYVRV